MLRDSYNEVIETVTNTKNGKVIFSPISYNQADIGKDFTYSIKEASGSEAGMDYDESVLVFRVHVSDRGGGELEVKVTPPSKMVFTNNYKASGSWIPEVSKILLGRELKTSEFSFELRDSEDKLLETATNRSDGKVIFSPISYSQDEIGKDFIYSINEAPGSENGMDYDDSVLVFSVHVSDKGGGELFVEVTPPSKTVFTNNYKASGSWTPEVSKVLLGRELEDNEFSFILAREGVELERVKNSLYGQVVFSDIVYSEEDIGRTYNYTIREEASLEEGMKIDDKEVRIEVAIEDAGEGLLNIEVNYLDDTSFINLYSSSGQAELILFKELIDSFGEKLELGGRVFEFEVYEFEEDLAYEETEELLSGAEPVATGVNDPSGVIYFTPISYTEEDLGLHHYRVVEKLGSLGGVGYTSEVIEIQVEVKDAGGGECSCKIIYPEGITFRNSYSYEPIKLSLEAGKVLEGRELVAGEFNFGVYRDNTLVARGVNDKSGKILFEEITLDRPGSYSFELRELADEDREITYDKKVIELTVVLSDKGDGSLDFKVTYKADPIFTNSYTRKTVDVTAYKKWKNPPDKKPVISLQLLQDGKAYGQPVKLDGIYEYTWKDLPEAGEDGKAYIYRVEELDIPEGCRVSYSEDGLTITNSYPPKKLPPLGQAPSRGVFYLGLSFLALALAFLKKRRLVKD